jgi:hypothetical protein
MLLKSIIEELQLDIKILIDTTFERHATGAALS